MKQVIQTDKRTGIRYVYEYECYWDKDKKQSRYSQRKLIGHIDEATGQVVANRPTKASPATPQAKRLFCGTDHLLSALSSDIGLANDLAKAFLGRDTALLSVAHYLIVEDSSALARFLRFSRTHVHPFGSEITSQRASELFASISQSELETFFKARISRSGDKYWLYDTTSISSYSKCIEYVRWGKNKDRVPLMQLNLAVVLDASSRLPVSFKDISGNISDVSLIRELIKESEGFGADKVKLCLDRGFYSKANIDSLMGEHMKFLIGLKVGLSYVKSAIKEHAHELRGWQNYHAASDVFGLKVAYGWDYEHHSRHTEVEHAKRRSYIYLYYSPERVAKDEAEFARSLQVLMSELESGQRTESHEKLYERYFKRVRGGFVGRDEVIERERELFGYFALLSNDASLSAQEALVTYRSKDRIEKAFADIKDRLDFRTPKVENVETLRGKLLCVFIALILTSELRARMDAAKLSERYTLSGLIDEIDTIERYESPRHRPRILAVTDKQKKIYEALGIKPPTVS